jgi:hypothetical protein
MANTGSRKPTKAEIAAAREYDRRLNDEGAIWNLELVLSREGEEDILATLAQYKNRKQFTPDMRRAVVGAVRVVLAGMGTKKAGARQ